jgi:flagella basal body P-ring formation protein FlgA
LPLHDDTAPQTFTRAVAYVLQNASAMRRSLGTPTSRPEHWRRFARSALVGILTVAGGALTAGAIAQAADERWQPPATIAEAARAAAERSADGEAEVTSVDERLKLARCDRALDATIERPITRGRGIVLVSCGAPEPWRLFVPVRLRNDATVLVLRRNVQPGDVLTTADLGVERRSSASLPHDYLSDSAQAVGLAVRRTQLAGAVVTSAALEAPEVVRRGELVTLAAGDGPVMVKSAGVAMEAARLKQRLKVRSASGRVVEGTAEGPGLVRVGL